MMTDPIADFCTRIRNACRIERAVVDIPANGVKIGLAEALKQEGFIYEYQVGHFKKGEGGVDQFEQTTDAALPKRIIRVYLKYGNTGERVIQKIRRISTPGLRRYVGATEIPRVRGGLGIAIVSTPQGVMSGQEARKKNVGGELVCYVW